MKFFNPNQPIATCKSESCDDCSLSGNLDCHASATDLMRLLLMMSPAMLIGGSGVYQFKAGMLIPWLVILLGYIGIVELRLIGAYILPGEKKRVALKSLPRLSLLKIWNYRFGSMTLRKNRVFFIGSAFAWGYPIYFLISGDQLFLLLVYLLAATSFVVTMRSFLCSRCTDFSCPLNSVDDYVRSDFYECNPSVAKLWARNPHTLNP